MSGPPAPADDAPAHRQVVAVAVVHGTGTVEPDFADRTIARLQERFAAALDDDEGRRAELVAQPVYWADITRSKEEDVWERVSGEEGLDQLELRRFIFNVMGDTLAYQPSEGRIELYRDVHRRVARSFATLAERAGDAAPLCIVAHSLGSVVIHNFLYDNRHRPAYLGDVPEPDTALARGETLALLGTYGSPIAIWRLRFGDEYRAIEFPGRGLASRYPGVDPRWFNAYDADDVLAYPIGRLTDRYRDMVRQGLLEDRRIRIGGLLSGWNPLVHYDYLEAPDVLDDLAGRIARLWRGAYRPEARERDGR